MHEQCLEEIKRAQRDMEDPTCDWHFGAMLGVNDWFAELTLLDDSTLTHNGSYIQNVLRELPKSPTLRKQAPIATGVVDYFPLALAAVAELSRAANEQHNPGQPLHWSRDKSTDHADCLMRHFIERGTIDTDGQRHSAKVAWRALAILQEELEASAGWEPK